MRVGQKQKKIDINIPKLDDFIHKTYINVARKVYKNVYLFEVNIEPLQVQKNYRETEIIVQECILNTLRESIPVETILKVYMDETIEEDVVEEVKEEIFTEPIKKPIDPVEQKNVYEQGENIQNGGSSRLSFSDTDFVKTTDGIESSIVAPKDFNTLEYISERRNRERKMEGGDDDDDDDNVKLTISNEDYHLDNLDIHNVEDPKLELLPDLLMDEIEVLE
jgi:hypothetical protein